MFKSIMYKVEKFIGKNKSEEENYGHDKPKKIYIDGDYFYIESKQYDIVDLKKVEYGHSEILCEVEECYIRLYSDVETNTLLHHIPYQVVNISIFIETMKKFSIPVLPTILKSYPEFVKVFSLTHSFDSSLYERGLISFWKDKNDIFCFFKPLDGGIYKKINTLDDIDLKSSLEKPRNNLKEYDNSYGEMLDNAKYYLVVLDKASTLNRGYGLYPISNKEIIIEDIFYSFDENEIKTKIIELFDKYLDTSKQNPIKQSKKKI